MKTTIVGYKNHALRLHSILQDMNVESGLWNHHTDDFSKVTDSDAVLISSPSHTHIEYIHRILDQSSAYIFCEKPPVTNSDDLDSLRLLPYNQQQRVFFNFNYRFSHLANLVKSKDLGSPVRFSFASSHGLALKDSFKDNWRFFSADELMGVYGTVGIHFVDLCLWLLGDYSEININKHNYSGSKTSDSVSINMKFKNGCMVDIFVSYVTPFINHSQLIFDNAILDLDNGELNLYEGRNTLDSNGNFAKPKRRNCVSYKDSKDYYNHSLHNSLRHFIDTATMKAGFSLEDFAVSIKSNEILLNGDK
jgi:predicted dehydrogenase